MIDLHMHTTCSDGQFSPEETIRMAAEAGVTVASVTDHDTVSGISDAACAAKRYGMRFFSGIEISAQGEKELHILGYGIDPENAALLAFCKKHASHRERRSIRMAEYLQRLGIPLTLADVNRCNDGKTSGRPHFARTLVEMGYAETIQDAFERYLTTPEYYAEVERPKPSPERSIRLIRDAGGVAVLAHPYLLGMESDELEELMVKLMEMGMQGIEAYYSRHTPEQIKQYLRLAKKYHLLVTCGSDFHGPSIKPDIALGSGLYGNLCVKDDEIPMRLAEILGLF